MKCTVIGLGRFGYQLATSLADQGMEVMAIDSNESIIAAIRDKVTQAVCLRVTSEDSLLTLGIEDMDIVVVAMGEDFAQSILITALLKKQLHVKNVIARAVSSIHESILMLVGADRVVFPEQDLGIKLANNLSFSLIEFFQVTEKFALTEIIAPKNFVGKTISNLNLKKSHQVSCIGVNIDEEINLLEPDYVIQAGDKLLIAGNNDKLANLAKEKDKE
ncbi:MAG: TrkA-N domain protein [candidate division TM6 bacterium GW2011_GWF2_28_16]|nr:MAG: TrkA-N domain protein [candidate division TM6 bacterium GW2011_GWF2_28_16]